MEKKNAFVFYFDWWKVLSNFSNEIKFEALDAIIAYSNRGVVPELSGCAKTAFEFMRKQMDSDAAKSEEKRKACSEAGKKGMQKRWGNRQSKC